MNKKLKIIVGIIISIIILWMIIFLIDYTRVSHFKEPIFVIKGEILRDGGSYKGYGLGYKVDVKKNINIENGIYLEKVSMYVLNKFIAGAEINPNENDMQSNTNNTENHQKYSKTIDSTRIELNIPNDWNYKEVAKDEENDFYKYGLKLYKNDENQYAILYFYNNIFGVCGTGRTSENITLNNGNEATIGYYDGSKNWSDISFYMINEYIAVLNNGLIDNEAQEVIEFIKTINIINEYSFCGTITQVEENLFFVEPDEDEEIRKSADKIMVQKLKLDTNVKFEIGEKVKITYDGDVMDTYPAQIKAIKYESLSVNNFELLFYDKQPQSDSKIHKIIDKNENEKYDYDIYIYDGNVNIRVDGNDYSLKNALLENKITMEEIIAKANKDFPDAEVIKDGGSMEYHYDNYTIIKVHKLDGNRNVYIGTKDMTINDLEI